MFESETISLSPEKAKNWPTSGFQVGRQCSGFTVLPFRLLLNIFRAGTPRAGSPEVLIVSGFNPAQTLLSHLR